MLVLQFRMSDVDTNMFVSDDAFGISVSDKSEYFIVVERASY